MQKLLRITCLLSHESLFLIRLLLDFAHFLWKNPLLSQYSAKKSGVWASPSTEDCTKLRFLRREYVPCFSMLYRKGIEFCWFAQIEVEIFLKNHVFLLKIEQTKQESWWKDISPCFLPLENVEIFFVFLEESWKYVGEKQKNVGVFWKKVQRFWGNLQRNFLVVGNFFSHAW